MLTINEYFSGNVKSIGFENQGKNSIGVMDKGEYTFGTVQPEKMTVIKGELLVRLPNTTEWQSFKTGESFEVLGNSSFDLQVTEQTAYLCEYL